MIPLVRFARFACTLALLSFPAISPAINLTTTNINGNGNNWTGNLWRTNSSGMATNGAGAVGLVATNTYETVANVYVPFIGSGVNNTRIRNPATAGLQNFVGVSLTMYTNTELRAKQSGAILGFPGTNGNPGLILKGGMLNAGDDATFAITGLVQVASQSYISQGGTGGGGGISPNRAFNFTGQLTGSGNMVILNAGTTIPQLVSGSANTFSGQWIVQCGWLVGTTNNSLGTNSIIVDPLYTDYLAAMPNVTSPTGPALLEPRYTLNSAGTLLLTNGGRMRLHQEVCFPSVQIHDAGLNVVSNLSAGIHYFPELQANFPNVFDASGSGAIVVQPFGTPPALPPTIQVQPIGAVVYSGGTARFPVTAVDNGFPPLTYQWRSNGVNITSSRFFGATNSILVISNASAAEAAATYDVVVANASFPVTSTAALLTLVPPSAEAYEAAVNAAKPIAFYQLNETGDPATNNSPAYDFVGGYYGIYGAGVVNGNPIYNIAGPLAGDGFPGFDAGNLAAQTLLGATTDPANSRITSLPWNLSNNVMTITAWVYPNSGQNPNEGLVFCRGGSTIAGLCYSSAASLGYNWNNEPDTYNWNSGLAPDPGMWSLVSLVVTPTKATIYVLNSTGLKASQHVYNHAMQGFEVAATIGDDTLGAGRSRSFNGKIDDVAIFNRALSQGELANLYSAASGIAGLAPYIALQPANTNVFQTQTVQFTALAFGSDTLVYQWQSAPANSGGPYVNVNDGGQFSGANTPALTIANADYANQADYIVVVTNSSGVATGGPANLSISATNTASNVTLVRQEGTGADWDLGFASPGANTNWSDFNPASYSVAQAPGNTYEVPAATRLRSPDGPVISTFPGRQLTITGDAVWNVNPPTNATIGELRFKQHTYGAVNGVVNIGKLIMNGGQLDLGNDGLMTLNGEIDVLTNAPFNNDSGNDRGYVINSWLTGSGSIEYHGYNNAYQSNYVNSLNIAGTSNTFSGVWNVVTGTLLGTGPKALGTNHIFVGTNAAVETTYDLNNTNAYLVITGGKMFLHQTNRFKAAVVNGVSIPIGTNTWTSLSANAAFSNAFPATWAPKTGATNFTAASGMIVISSNAVPLITQQPRSATNRGQLSVSFNVAAVGGAPLGYQWRAGAAGSGTFTNVLNSTSILGATNSVLTISNLGIGNAGDYLVVVANNFGATTSSVARLTDLPLPFITLQPVSQTNSGTLTAQFYASALGDLPMTYQWRAAAIGSGGPYTNVSGAQYIGGTTTNLTVNNLAISNSADLIIIFSNFAGSVTSTPATLTVIDPMITQQPTPAGTQNIYQQAGVQWTVGILGTAPLTSTWQGGPPGSGFSNTGFTNLINGPRISGATTTTLTILNVDHPDEGDYRYIVSNASGSVTSSVVTLTVSDVLGVGQNFTLDFIGTPIQQPGGSDWNTLNNWNPGGDSAANSAGQYPGSTYTVVPGARLRTPTNAVNAFPGLFTPGTELIVQGIGVFTNSPPAGDLTMGELRLKHSGGIGTENFRKLTMNGGQINNGDNNPVIIQGQVQILANTPFYVDSGGNNGRAFRVEAQLLGSANIEYRDFDASFGTNGGLVILCPTNNFNGTWHVVLGALIGAAPNALGTNSITVDAGGALETTYNLNTPTANLVLNGRMFLHSADTFRTVTIGNYVVPAGTYSYAQWAASFPGNFPATWNLQQGSSVNTASGSITVLNGPSVNTISNSFSVVGNTLVFSGTGGIPYGKFYVLSTTDLTLPKASWTRSGPYPFDNVGMFSVPVPISPSIRQQFFQLQQILP